MTDTPNLKRRWYQYSLRTLSLQKLYLNEAQATDGPTRYDGNVTAGGWASVATEPPIMRANHYFFLSTLILL